MTTRQGKRLGLLLVSLVLLTGIGVGWITLVPDEAFLYGDRPGIFWLEAHKFTVLVLMALSLLTALALILSRPEFLSNTERSIIDGALALTALCSLVIGCVVITLSPSTALKWFWHEDSMITGRNVYIVADRTPLEGMEMRMHACRYEPDPGCREQAFFHEYIIFRCGPMGIICRTIHTEVYWEETYASHGSLEWDSADQVVVFKVNEEPVWNYAP